MDKKKPKNTKSAESSLEPRGLFSDDKYLAVCERLICSKVSQQNCPVENALKEIHQNRR
jgi:hypothetical protein